MIKELTVINNHKESLTLSLSNPWPTGFAITQIEGLTPPKATINTTELSVMDGSVFNSSRVTSRNIVISFKLLPNKTIEEVRQTMYKYFPVKLPVTIVIKSDTREVYTVGYVESNTANIFSNFETAQVSLICPDPFFYSVEEKTVELYGIDGKFTFPFSNPVGEQDIIFGEISTTDYEAINYLGEASTGVNIRLLALGTVVDPVVRNATLDQTMTIVTSKLADIVGTGFIEGDEIFINTNRGRKTVTHVRDGVYTNVMPALGNYSDWISLENGENAIVYSADSGRNNLSVFVTYNDLYNGI